MKQLCFYTLLPTIDLFYSNSFIKKAPRWQFSLGQTHSEINTVGPCYINAKYPLIFKSNIESKHTHTHTHPNNNNIIFHVIEHTSIRK